MDLRRKKNAEDTTIDASTVKLVVCKDQEGITYVIGFDKFTKKERLRARAPTHGQEKFIGKNDMLTLKRSSSLLTTRQLRGPQMVGSFLGCTIFDLSLSSRLMNFMS